MHLTENWRLKGPRYNLTTTRNTETQELTFPPRKIATRELDVFEFEAREEEAQRESEASVSEGLPQ